MVLLEAVHVTITALAPAALGIACRVVAAQSLLGSVSVPPAWTSPTVIAPAIPGPVLYVVVAATAVLTVVAAVVPTRLATRVTAVEALAEGSPGGDRAASGAVRDAADVGGMPRSGFDRHPLR